MAKRLASVRTGDDEPSPKATREALRDVIGRCLYGVDVNPMAAELCRVSLWMEALVPGRPLSFLDHHIQVGNSLLGTTSDLISGGIPDDAFKRIEGDDNKLTSDYRKRNREERKAWEAGQLSFSLRNLDRNRETIERGYEEIEEGEESSVAAVREKAAQYADLQDSEEMFHARRLADAWCAAFVWPKTQGAPDAVTQELFAYLTQDTHSVPRETEGEIEQIARQYKFFHWHLAFPGVFDEERPGGFDVVLGNPPWGKVKLQEKKWFASRDPAIANTPNASARKRRIMALETENPKLHREYLTALRRTDGASHLARNSGRYPLCGRGDVNTYSIFAETNRTLLSSTGRAGFIVPSGIATDDTTKEFFGELVEKKSLVSFYGFENRRKIFPSVQGNVEFCLLTLSSTPQTRLIVSAQLDDPVLLVDPDRRYEISVEDIRRINPNTMNLPTMRTAQDAKIIKEIYRRIPILIDENTDDGNPWQISFLRMFDMTNDSGLFGTLEDLEAAGWSLEGNIFNRDDRVFLPLYEAKLVHQFHHRAATFDGIARSERFKTHAGTNSPTLEDLTDPYFSTLPRYWVTEREVTVRLDRNTQWLLGFRNAISAVADSRSLVGTILPMAGVGNSMPLIMSNSENDELGRLTILLTAMNSSVMDYVLRQKASGGNLNFYILKQLPFLSLDTYDGNVPWDMETALRDWLTPRALELTYTAWDLEPFARDLGYDGPPFRWDPERRFLLRCELDAAFFHLYGIERDDVDYIMETFPIVERKDEAAHDEYRTKRVILEIYDQMARATETGEPYQTPLDPPPVELDLSSGESVPATVTPLRPTEKRPYHQHEESRSASMAAEEKTPYGEGINRDTNKVTRGQPEDLADTTLEGKDFSHLQSEHRVGAGSPAPDQGSDTPPEATLFPDNEVETKNTIPSIEEAALAIHACVSEGEKVRREKLLLDAARELGHTKLTTKVRRSLNKALNVEHNKKRLRTDWKVVWKPKRK